jgi:hypothetical protein
MVKKIVLDLETQSSFAEAIADLSSYPNWMESEALYA